MVTTPVLGDNQSVTHRILLGSLPCVEVHQVPVLVRWQDIILQPPVGKERVVLASKVGGYPVVEEPVAVIPAVPFLIEVFPHFRGKVVIDPVPVKVGVLRTVPLNIGNAG